MSIGSLDFAVNAATEQIANVVINQGLVDALQTMQNMVGNAGQQTIYNNYVVDEFTNTRQSINAGDEWPGVEIGQYMDFMGEIVEEGNTIMEDACLQAADIMEAFSN